MVKFGGLVNDGKGRLIGIALSRKNCERLLDGEPITFDLNELGMAVCDDPGGTGSRYGTPMPARVLIVAGETEDAILTELVGAAREVGADIEEMGPDGKPRS